MKIFLFVLAAIALICVCTGGYKISGVVHARKKKGRKKQADIDNRKKQLTIGIILLVIGFGIGMILDLVFEFDYTL